MPQNRKDESLIAWKTVTYKSVIVGVLLLVTAIGVVAYFAFPGPTKAAMDAMGNGLASLFSRMGTPKKAARPLTGPQQANFTAIEGTVRVKRHNTDTWVQADFNTPLEKGDVVQTLSEGIARIVFADGSNYTVKPDSLIVIEENSMNQAQQTDVSVTVTTGTVDLSTAAYTQGSRSGVTVAGASATFSAETSAQVHNDPKADTHEIMVKKGSGEVTRNGESVKLTDYERVSFHQDAAHMAKTKEMAPPVLIAPSNMMPIFSGGEAKPVEFAWSPVPSVRIYHLRVSHNPYFSSVALDKKVGATSVVVPGLTEGAYYWMVQAVDDSGKESVESERNRFTIIAKAAAKSNIALELLPFVQHGHVIEVKGKTEPSARVMVNGEEVPIVNDDGTFQYFTRPLPQGESMITVTAQNLRGGVATEQKKVVIQ